MRFLIAAGFLALAGCGDTFSGDAAAVNDICVKNGGKAPYCACVTKALEAKLSKEQFAAMAKGGEAASLGDNLDAISAADASCPKA